MSRSKRRKNRSASGSSSLRKNTLTSNHSSIRGENIGERVGEREYKISIILDDWKKIVGFYIACIAVLGCSTA